MIEMCPYCKVNTAGNHELGCPNNPLKIVSQNGSQTIYRMEDRINMALYGYCIVCGYGFGAGTKQPEMIGMLEYVCPECRNTEKYKKYMVN